MYPIECSELLVSLGSLDGGWDFFFSFDIGAKVMLTKESMGPAHCEASFRMAELRVKKEEKRWSLLNLGEAALKFRPVIWFDNI